MHGHDTDTFKRDLRSQGRKRAAVTGTISGLAALLVAIWIETDGLKQPASNVPWIVLLAPCFAVMFHFMLHVLGALKGARHYRWHMRPKQWGRFLYLVAAALVSMCAVWLVSGAAALEWPVWVQAAWIAVPGTFALITRFPRRFR